MVRWQLLGAAFYEGPGLLPERLPVAMAFSQVHLGELGQGHKMQFQSHNPLRQERLARDGQEKLLLIRLPAEVRPWENGYIESFNGKLQNELLDRELFDILWEVSEGARGALAADLQPDSSHSALSYRPPAPEAIAPQYA